MHSDWALTWRQAQGGANAGLEAPTIDGKRLQQRSIARRVCPAHCLFQASTGARSLFAVGKSAILRSPATEALWCTHFTLLAAKMMCRGRG
jgi:hypothetical protein